MDGGVQSGMDGDDGGVGNLCPAAHTWRDDGEKEGIEAYP